MTMTRIVLGTLLALFTIVTLVKIAERVHDRIGADGQETTANALLDAQPAVRDDARTDTPTTAPDAGLLIGTWECEGTHEAGAFESTIVFTSDGRTSSFESVSMRVDADTGASGTSDILIEMIGNGTWALSSGGMLETRVEDADLVSVTVDGALLPDAMASERLGPLVDALPGSVSSERVVALDANRLETTSVVGDATCRR